MDLVEGAAGGIVHGDMDVLPADTTMDGLALPASGDAMPGAPAAPELLYVDVDHVAGNWVLVAAGRFRRTEIPGPAEPYGAQDAADGGWRAPESTDDLVSRQALTTQLDDRLHDRTGRRAMQSVRTRRAPPKAFGAFCKEAVYPLSDGLAAHAEGFGDGAPACAFLNHTPDHLGSTMRRCSGILMNVNSVSFPGAEVSQPQSPRSVSSGQPIERSQLGANIWPAEPDWVPRTASKIDLQRMRSAEANWIVKRNLAALPAPGPDQSLVSKQRDMAVHRDECRTPPCDPKSRASQTVQYA